MYRHIVLLLFILGGFSLSAQSFEEYRQHILEEFADFKAQKDEEFNSYRDSVNADFVRFMRKSWKKYHGEPSVPEPREIPDVPPVSLPDLEIRDLPDNEVPYVDVVPLEFDDMSPVPLVPLPGESGYGPEVPHVDIEFYGTECSFRFDMGARVWLSGTSENSAADMWEAMCSEPYETLLMDCLLVRKDMELCDWAYYKLAYGLAETIYGKCNESVMLAAFIMNQSGYRLKIARSEDGTFHLLIGTADGMYGFPYFCVNGCDYYLTDGSDVCSLYILDKDFPDENSLRLSIGTSQKFAESRSESRSLKSKGFPDAATQVEINRNLLEFYGDYPHPFKNIGIKASWMFYATAPLDNVLKEALLQPLASSVAGKTQSESANILLNFVQTAFDYQTDDEQWGYERPFFPEETMYYPASDCEDRAILYFRLVRELLGLDVVFLYYPGHLATAVRFDEDVCGDYIMVGGEKYMVCDPTYINAPVGMQMPGLDVSGIKAIRISD